MKKYIAYFVCFSMLFAACSGGGKKSDHNHDHSHDTEHACSGDHDHGHDDHNHDHEGHNHDAHEHDHEGCEHDHGAAVKETDAHSDDEIVFTKAQAAAVGLQTQVVKKGDFNLIIKTGGRIEAANGDELTLVATANGVVTDVKRGISEGSAVKAGETILTLSTQGILDGDQLQRAKLSYGAAKREFDRAEALLKDSLISRKEYEQLKLTYDTERVTYQAIAGSRNAKGISISSSISGYVKNLLVAEGEYVTTGQPLATVSQNRRLQLKADVSEKYYKNLPTISSANFKTPYDTAVYKLSALKGRMLSYGRSADRASFYIPVTFEFDNVGQIIPGSFVEVYLLSSPISNVIAIPLSALTEEQGLYFVYIQLEDEHYEKREVTRGDDNGSHVLILSGLHEGEKVVTKGTYQVKLAASASVIPEGHSHSH